MEILIFFVAHWYLSLSTQTFFHHRYASHQMFTMSKGMEKVFFVLSWVFQGASYLSPYAYGILHRLHHAHADTELDPHSPKYDKNLMHMMWKTKQIYNDILYGRADIDSKFMKDLPEWKSFDKLGDWWPMRIMWGLFYIGFYVVFATEWWMFLLLPVHFVMGPIHGAIINWFAHRVGYKNFKVKDTSKNLFPIELFMWGEGLHNNHHKYGARANFAVKWWEFDPMYPIIRLLHFFKIIKLKKVPVKS